MEQPLEWTWSAPSTLTSWAQGWTESGSTGSWAMRLMVSPSWVLSPWIGTAFISMVRGLATAVTSLPVKVLCCLYFSKVSLMHLFLFLVCVEFSLWLSNHWVQSHCLVAPSLNISPLPILSIFLSKISKSSLSLNPFCPPHLLFSFFHFLAAGYTYGATVLTTTSEYSCSRIPGSCLHCSVGEQLFSLIFCPWCRKHLECPLNHPVSNFLGFWRRAPAKGEKILDKDMFFHFILTLTWFSF